MINKVKLLPRLDQNGNSGSRNQNFVVNLEWLSNLNCDVGQGGTVGSVGNQVLSIVHDLTFAQTVREPNLVDLWRHWKVDDAFKVPWFMIIIIIVLVMQHLGTFFTQKCYAKLF